MDTQELLLEEYPVRRTRRQRERFLAYAKTYAESLGWDCRYLRCGTSVCLLIGDEAAAKICISSCYETPGRPLVPAAVYPAARPLTVFLRLLPLILTVLVFPAAALTARTGLTLMIFDILFLTAAICFTLRTFLRPANRENCNCNSSGCAVLLHLLKTLSANNRKKAVFLLWDKPDERRSGLTRARKHIPSLASLPFVHLSCLGEGDRLLILQQKNAEPDGARKDLIRALKHRGARAGVPVDPAGVRHGVLCGTLRRCDAELCAASGALPFSRIRNVGTNRDTQYDPELLLLVSVGLRSAVESL